LRAAIPWAWRWFLGAAAVWLLLVVPGFVAPSTATDYLLNLGRVPRSEALAAPSDGRRHLVVLQHGLLRAGASLWRLQRTLEANGYEVLNPSYPSTVEGIEDHAAALATAVQARLSDGDARPVALYAVGHSMGGLVIEEWLAGSAVQPEACVFIGTPHRGAMLCDLRRDGLLFRLFLGDAAAVQLSPGDAFQGRVIRNLGDVGVIVGGLGDGEGFSGAIPGDDDGTVGVDEARFPARFGDGIAVRDELLLPQGHTRLSFSPAVHEAVATFLRHRKF